MRKVLYVPLDDRDCNYQFPWLLSQMTEGLELLRPPYEWMGFLKKPADREKIWEWLFEQAGECDYAILSVESNTTPRSGSLGIFLHCGNPLCLYDGVPLFLKESIRIIHVITSCARGRFP